MEALRAVVMLSIIATIILTALSIFGAAIYLSFHYKNMERLRKTFRVVTSISMIITIAAASLSIIGITITGLYPGIIGLLLAALIPIGSRRYAKKINIKSNIFQRNYYLTLPIINLLSILLVLFMTFVIVHDRVFLDA